MNERQWRDMYVTDDEASETEGDIDEDDKILITDNNRPKDILIGNNS